MQGKYNVTDPTKRQIASMRPHRDQWNRVIDEIS
jgi:hypothetical protein